MAVNVVEQIFDLFERFGSQRYGEDATQLQHASQTAGLARSSGCGDTLVAAALLHDIGQLMGDTGGAAELLGIDARHEVGGHASPAGIFLRRSATPYACMSPPSVICARWIRPMQGASAALRR